ncbi:hypothetical protein [Micromonospora luteifusca]|uniref:Uncharacterized protein n=1 Tax=Micromonospora luteifusca TaxID=709860 RepID=A0ABS2LYA3_9ACTN|nr:hypothetical protein [Micromonospora luteifusca]MBM7493173.1 hypothetical protein [Micromonospora luteifusca]
MRACPARHGRPQRLYERHGYVVEGRHTAEFLIDGEFVDDLALAESLRPASDGASRPVAG